MNAIEQLQTASACRALIVRAAGCADNNDARALADLFTEDARLVRPGGDPLLGREAIFAAYAKRPADRMTRHLVTNTELEMLADGRVRAVSYALVIAGSRNDEATPQGRKASSCQMGEFHDTLVLTGQGWRIAQREASFVLYVP